MTEIKPEEIDAVAPNPQPEDTPEPKGEEPASEVLAFPNASGGLWHRKVEKAKNDAPTTKRRPGRPPGSRSRKSVNIKEGLTVQFTMIGLLVSARNEYDGKVIVKNAPKLAASFDDLAKENEAVRKALEMLLVAGAWSQVAGVVAAIAIPIAANHGVIPQHVAQVALPLTGMEPPPVEGKATSVD